MTSTTVTNVLQRTARLIPASASGPSRVTGHPVWVLTSPVELPAEFRQAQEERRAHYLATGQRVPSGDLWLRELASRAPRYVVTSYGIPIAWVTLDGATHYAELPRLSGALPRAMQRHQATVRDAWPARFALDSMGDPVHNDCGQLLRPDGLPAYRNHLPARVCDVCGSPRNAEGCTLEIGHDYAEETAPAVPAPPAERIPEVMSGWCRYCSRYQRPCGRHEDS